MQGEAISARISTDNSVVEIGGFQRPVWSPMVLCYHTTLCWECMPEEDTTDNDRWLLDRRRLLQATGVGIGTVSVAGFSGDIASAKTGCANGPFEATYSAGTVNMGQIRADHARDESPPAIRPGSPPGEDERRSSRSGAGDQPPRNAAKATNTDADGPLTVRTEYDGVNSLETRGGVPSDSQVAAGNGKLIHALNRNIAIYNKQSGRREQLINLEDLWEPVIDEPEGGFVSGVPFVFDPRARYDRKDDRYIVCATQYQEGIDEDGNVIDREELEEAAEEGDDVLANVTRPPRGWFLVAVSANSNPNGNWYVYRIPPEDADGVDNMGLVDYPTLGFDQDAIYLTQNFFADEFDVTMVTLDKAAMYAGEEVTAYHFDGMNDPDSDGFTFTVQPAQQPFSGGSSGTYYLVNSDSAGASRTLTLWELADPLDDPSLECFTLDVDRYTFPPNARQPESESRIDTIGTRLMNVDYDDGSLWTAHATGYSEEDDEVAAIKWYEIDAASREVVQSGVYGEPGTSYFMPTIGADDGRMILVHNVSGSDTYVRMDVAGRTADFTEGMIEDSIVIEEGKSRYDALPGLVERWGDYNGFSIDPSSGRFWTVSQYSPDIDIPVEDETRDPYFTRIAEVDFDENGLGGGPK